MQAGLLYNSIPVIQATAALETLQVMSCAHSAILVSVPVLGCWQVKQAAPGERTWWR